MNPPILYEDPDLLAVIKPAGIVVVPARGEDPEASLRRVMERARAESLFVVHRLDRDTSGVVLFARHAASHRALSLAFERREVSKSYLALVRGAPPALQGTLDVPLHTARRGKMRPALPGEPGALPSVTEYTVLRRWACGVGPVCLLEAQPRTGRQHQLRVHLRSSGAPLLVDPLYGRAESVSWRELGVDREGVACGRLTLHAWRLSLRAPGGARLTLEAPLAEELQSLVDGLNASFQEARG